MGADRAKPLDDHLGAIQVDQAEVLGRLGGDGQPEGGGAQRIERDAPQDLREADDPTHLVVEIGHAGLVDAHVGSGDVVTYVGDGPSEGTNQSLLVGQRNVGIGDDAGLATSVAQPGRRVLVRHGPGEASNLVDRDGRPVPYGSHRSPAQRRCCRPPGPLRVHCAGLRAAAPSRGRYRR